MISELKAETLMTSLLREKLYCKELEVEQLQAELATAVRSADILKYEVQNALDNLSCVTHKFKDLELQVFHSQTTTCVNDPTCRISLGRRICFITIEHLIYFPKNFPRMNLETDAEEGREDKRARERPARGSEGDGRPEGDTT